MKKNNSTMSLGILLILIGLGLLLHRMGLLDFTYDQLYPVICLAVGAYSAVSLLRGNKNSALAASFLILFGLITFVRNYDLLTTLWALEIWSILILCLGLAFIIMYFFKPQDWGVLIPGSILTFIGLIMVLNDLDYSWHLVDQIRSLWPIILIIIGVGILVSSFRKKTN